MGVHMEASWPVHEICMEKACESHTKKVPTEHAERLIEQRKSIEHHKIFISTCRPSLES